MGRKLRRLRRRPQWWQLLLVLSVLLSSTSACSPPSPEFLALDAGPGSAEPHLAVSEAGEVVLSYLVPEGDETALRFHRLTPAGWSPAQTLIKSPDLLANWADFPGVVPLAANLWAAQWLTRRNSDGFAYDAQVALSKDAGQTWSKAQTIHDDVSAVEHGFVSLYHDGHNPGAVWLDGRSFAASAGANPTTQLLARTWSQAQDLASPENLLPEQVVDERVCDCCQTDAVRTADGVLVAYRNRTEAEIRDIYVARLQQGVWHAPVNVAVDHWEIKGCPVNGPAVAANGHNVAVAWFTATPTNRIRLVFSTDGGRSFRAPINVATEQPLGRVDVSLLEDGSSIVSWLERGSGELRIRQVAMDGTLGAVRKVINMATHRDAGFPRMIRAGQRLIFAWTDTSDESSRVRTAAIAL